ncbi:exonuclease domain-containing protein [Actinopolyspora mortivallis]|uniref:DNA polymerase III subunit epsilon n=1 Tax=Actinopolyspora mortivallis TaxID=33906 RepID=A0A2T0GYK4_ACTMO|nr:exonuclease domain-containing protein [Actinopolyspora mortivallis]PRW64184.1 DNA polymerase III subunit epsilon [Actinopolyspora mortivallis]
MNDSAQSWADGPLLALDLETTGTDTDTDRIVTATVVSVVPGSPAESTDWLADPGVEIPAESAEVHGISTEYARANGSPAATVVAGITEFLAARWSETTPLIAFNASFDLSLLDSEARRHLGVPLSLGGPVVDPLCIDRHMDRYRKGKRTLAALCEHHRVKAEDAHTSSGDAIAAARLAWRLAKTYPERVGTVPLRTLHEQQVEWYRSQTRGFAVYLEKQADKADDEAEAQRLRQRAARVRTDAEGWPLRQQALVSGV